MSERCKHFQIASRSCQPHIPRCTQQVDFMRCVCFVRSFCDGWIPHTSGDIKKRSATRIFLCKSSPSRPYLPVTGERDARARSTPWRSKVGGPSMNASKAVELLIGQLIRERFAPEGCELKSLFHFRERSSFRKTLLHASRGRGWGCPGNSHNVILQVT